MEAPASRWAARAGLLAPPWALLLHACVVAGPSGTTDAGPPTSGGFVGVSSAVEGSAFSSSILAFFSGPPSGQPLELERYEDAECRSVKYESGTAAAWVRGLSAGTLTVGGLAGPGDPLLLSPEGCDTVFGCDYGITWAGADLFAAGSVVTASAAGADVPPFSLSVAAPAPLTLLEPDLANAATALDLGLVPGQPMTLRWVPAGGEGMQLSVASDGASGAYTRLSCSTEDDGELVVSAEATALLAGVEPVLYVGFARTAFSPEGGPVYLFVSSGMAWVLP